MLSDDKSSPLKYSAPHSTAGAFWALLLPRYFSGPPDFQGLLPNQRFQPSFIRLQTVERLCASGEVDWRGLSMLRVFGSVVLLRVELYLYSSLCACPCGSWFVFASLLCCFLYLVYQSCRRVVVPICVVSISRSSSHILLSCCILFSCALDLLCFVLSFLYMGLVSFQSGFLLLCH